MRVIKGSEAHVAPCMEVARSLRTHFDLRALERMPDDLRSQDLYVAQGDEGEVIGFISLLMDQGGVAEIAWMGVMPELQGMGVGTSLLNTAVDHLVQAGVSTLMVRTLADTVDYEPYEGTRAFYRSRGFHLEEVIDPYPGWAPGNPCAVYLRALP